MELFGHFTYAGVDSSTSAGYDLILANVSTNRKLGITGSVKMNTVFNKKVPKNYFISDDYADSALSYSVDIVTDSGSTLTVAQRRAIEKWLFYTSDYRKLYINAADDCEGETTEGTKRLYMNCRFTEPEKIEGNGGIIGFSCTLETDSPLAWQDATENTYTLSHSSSSASSQITVTVDSDMIGYVYPEVTIQMGSANSDVTIVNNTDSSSRLTKFTNLTASASVVMKGDINYISGQNYEKFTDKNFVRLLDGSNTLTVTGNVSSVKIKWQNRRYV